ncbi:MAG: MFS transporter, partial [Myxococcales bacterium]
MNIDAAPLGATAPARMADDSPRRRFVILVTCCLALVLTAMDATIVNIALPAIRSDLHASVAELQWSIDAYTIIVASFLLLAGSVADRFGRRKTFQTGLLVFTFGSLLCSVAPNAKVLVASRALQALGGAMLNPVA